ncbi:hypothetical protein BUALT_Bualt02G0037400 [Buddleja alternifolia]|uniref:Uncharacterized protein n=1 Tax=Buddleja alternifolia TaxID=168488 RepID=A0AAV6Y7V5_9LAMI|nr:hypothetical protein BUALT_Bualt02G0037400 [Buddleja alternifolia]
MGSGWRRLIGNVRSFMGNSVGGLRGSSSLVSVMDCCRKAYYLWVRPSAAAQKRTTGLAYGNKNGAKKSE